jgi:lipoprotein-releasing system permease protein
MLKLFLWLRYLRKRKIVFLSIAAVALSVSLLIVVASLFSGFIKTFERAAVEAVGDVVLSSPMTFEKYPLLIEQLEQTESVEAATAMISGYGLLHLGRGNVRAVEVWGIEPAGRAKVTGFAKFLRRQGKGAVEPSFNVPDSPEETGGFVGIGVLGEPDEQTDEYDYEAAEKMLGETVVLTTGTVTGKDSEDGSMPEFKRQVMRFAIADIIETGVYQFDSGCVYLPIEKLHSKLYPDAKSPVASQILIKLADNTDADVALAVIRGVWRAFVQEQLDANPYLMTSTAINTARQLQSRYIAAYEKQMGILLLIFGVISFGVVLLVFCIFYMIVRLKQKDIAIIKSCGATSSSVAFVFVGFGACVGVVGSGLGAILGYIITRNVNTIEDWIRIIFGLKLWKSSVYLFSKIPNEVNWSWATRIVLMAIIAAAIGTLIPAIVAARTKPVNILRYE